MKAFTEERQKGHCESEEEDNEPTTKLRRWRTARERSWGKRTLGYGSEMDLTWAHFFVWEALS